MQGLAEQKSRSWHCSPAAEGRGQWPSVLRAWEQLPRLSSPHFSPPAFALPHRPAWLVCFLEGLIWSDYIPKQKWDTWLLVVYCRPALPGELGHGPPRGDRWEVAGALPACPQETEHLWPLSSGHLIFG